MTRNIHSIYDVILKIIATVYLDTFLSYIGIDEEIKEVLNIEFPTLSGSKKYLDFLCLLKNGTILHIEFQFPEAKHDDLDRFFNYNIIVQARYGKLTETIVFNFTFKKNKEKAIKIGKSKSFHPKYFYLGDLPFKEHIKKINIKVKSNEKLTNFEEITLMLICLNPN